MKYESHEVYVILSHKKIKGEIMKKKLIVMSLLISAFLMATDNEKGLTDSSKYQKSAEVNKNEDKKPQMGAPMNKKVITEDMITNKTENG